MDEPAELTDLIRDIADVQRRMAAIALRATELNLSGIWAYAGAVSMRSWLRDRARLSKVEADQLLSTGRFLTRFPEFAAAAMSGVLAAGHVKAMDHAVTDRTAPILGEQQAAMVVALAPLSVAEASMVAAVWQQRAEALVAAAEPKAEPERDLAWATADDGVRLGRFVMDPAMAVQFERAIQTASTYEADDQRSAGRRRADALFDVVAFFNANHDRPGTPRHRPHVELHFDVTATVPGRLHDIDLTAFEWSRDAGHTNLRHHDALVCDCVVHRVLREESAVLDYGRATRTVALDLFRAVAARDRGCRFPGCDRPVAWCEAHHIRYWRHGGTTDLSNLTLFCQRHHHLIHDRSYEVKLLPDATVEITINGTVRTSTPRGRVNIRSPIDST